MCCCRLLCFQLCHDIDMLWRMSKTYLAMQIVKSENRAPVAVQGSAWKLVRPRGANASSKRYRRGSEVGNRTGRAHCGHVPPSVFPANSTSREPRRRPRVSGLLLIGASAAPRSASRAAWPGRGRDCRSLCPAKPYCALRRRTQALSSAERADQPESHPTVGFEFPALGGQFIYINVVGVGAHHLRHGLRHLSLMSGAPRRDGEICLSKGPEQMSHDM